MFTIIKILLILFKIQQRMFNTILNNKQIFKMMIKLLNYLQRLLKFNILAIFLSSTSFRDVLRLESYFKVVKLHPSTTQETKYYFIYRPMIDPKFKILS